MNLKYIDITGVRFGRLVAIERTRDGKEALWVCQCDCGKTSKVRGNHLRIGKTRSCGCLHEELIAGIGMRRFVHGFSRSANHALYEAYRHAKRRCTNPKDKNYFRYGGRGIEFRFTSVHQLLECIGPKPDPTYSLDRINNDGHYEPGNVRWATNSQQQLNRRHTHKHSAETKRKMREARLQWWKRWYASKQVISTPS